MVNKINTTHVLMKNELIVYRRERSEVWQCRFKVGGLWQRATTKETDLVKAKHQARELMIVAEIRKRSNLPVITRKFRSVAALAIQRMEQEQASGNGKVSYSDYIRVINEYLIPFFGSRNITNIDYAVLDQFNAWRISKMGKSPANSTLLTHNAALNRVLDEAVMRNFLTEANKPILEAKGKVGERRPDFDVVEIRAVLQNLEDWITRAKSQKSRETREIMRDYINMIIDTGARPGDELLNLKWKQIKFVMRPTVTPTSQVDEEGEQIDLTNLNRSCELVVSGKTGTRTIVAMKRTVEALERIVKRNYGVKNLVTDPFMGVAIPSNNDYVLRTKGQVDVRDSFQKMFEHYLKDHNLLIDPRTDQKRVFYSLRHTYATLALTHDKVPIHTLAKQMGTSVLMIEKHYSHLDVVQAIDQLRGEETKKLIDAGGVVDENYKSQAAAKVLSSKKGRSAP